jgi:glycosyltransferase involved in cell wall biosynthesis
MLSVNIPVFNIEVGDLVMQVYKQAQQTGIDFEIRIFDDCSKEEYKKKNRHLSAIPGIIYTELPENKGRSAIRNLMGRGSDKDYLLFIDADSVICSERYVENYLKHANPGCVLCGGTSYQKEKPYDHKKMLRWVYGQKREAISAGQRNKQKGFIITSNNFLIDSKVFQRIQFRENIGPYGHEDTLLGYDLFINGIVPLHIDNPVEHAGLEESEVFLVKTREALENLYLISEGALKNAPAFTEQVKFLKRYHKITRFISPFFLRMAFNFFEDMMVKNLTGKNPNLIWFDLFKAGYFAKLKYRA